MSKFRVLWEYASKADEFPLVMSFDEISSVLGFPIDHSFLTYKKEASDFGLTVKKIFISRSGFGSHKPKPHIYGVFRPLRRLIYRCGYDCAS